MPFLYKLESKEFGKALIDMAIKVHKEQLSQYISKENQQSFRHGRNWLNVREDGIEESSFSKKGVELSLCYQDVLNNDIEKFFSILVTFIEGFTSQTVNGIFETISESCDKTGNTVNQKDLSSPAEAFLEMLKKIEFSVDENGQIVLPQIHVGTDAAKPLLQSLEEQSEEFQNEIERVKREKSEAALKKEKERLNKFKGIDL